ncbi:hypothetical protein [Hymenobacter cellulosilyticus]|uniref:Uncharacterized protein n=1 Tax=Hymenobacter cellulosilyticus TaxID=2932248 RepID=A0A8T9QI83_9BACT|nr:hypothetical protein [Hymenobacter cellulosilyticus]UOQ74503.1 hypothetical protein MUN79_11840 [Hymenobacter cellulosilyticus]
MKAGLWALLAGAGLLALPVAGYFYLRGLPCETCAHDSAAPYLQQLEAQRLAQTGADPEHYQAAVRQEDRQHKRFPPTPPAYALVHVDRRFTAPQRLGPAQLQQLLRVLNDSASYQWGEIGTPYFDRVITFHSAAGACIGVTELSYDSQTYSTPRLARMKWGELQEQALQQILQTLHDPAAITEPALRP